MATKSGHLIIRFKDAFYFIPEDKVGPPVGLTKSSASEIKRFMDELKAKHPENFGDALRVDDKDLIRLCARN